MTGQGTETGRNALAGLPAVQSRRLRRNRLYRRGERTFSSLGRRKSSTLQDSSTWNYTYNQRSEITSAIRKNASNVTQNTMRYGFDNIGNRTSSYENPTSKTYSANSLNQYTGIDVVGSSSISPQYDDDGNMTGYGSWTYTWDAENRLVKAVNGTTRLEFIYDALSRRVARKLYLNNTLSKHHRYVYDGMKLLATYNAKSSFAKINSFLWQPFGLDVPLIMTYNSTVYGYLVDANKNVLGLFNPSKTRVATYLYGPFGQKLSESGTIAANNPLQFSSEQFDADLGFIYYNYRYYSPATGKWLTKDPIGEEGGWNLYAFCRNNAVNTWDVWGLQGIQSIFGPPSDYFFQMGKIQAEQAERQRKIDELTKKFNDWYETEYNNIYYCNNCEEKIKDDAWIKNLTPCPEHITIAFRRKNYVPIEAGISPDYVAYLEYDKNEWVLSMTPRDKLKRYHPDASFDLRSAKPTKDGRGNQCVYDSNGNLIKYNGNTKKEGTPSAGTADYYTPKFSILSPHTIL